MCAFFGLNCNNWTKGSEMVGSMWMVTQFFTVFHLITSNSDADIRSFRPVLWSFGCLWFRRHVGSQGGTDVAEQHAASVCRVIGARSRRWKSGRQRRSGPIAYQTSTYASLQLWRWRQHSETLASWRILCVWFFWGGRNIPPPVGQGLLIHEVSNHTLRHTTVGGTPLNEWSAHRRDLYLTSQNTPNRQTSMPSVRFEPTISAGERPQTHALRAPYTLS